VDEGVLANFPVLNKLDVSDAPAAAKRTAHQANAALVFAFALNGVDDNDILFGFKIFKGHVYSVAFCSATLCCRMHE